MTRKTLSRYGLAKDPFTKDVPPEELFDHPAREDAIQKLQAAIDGRTSAVVTGDAGVGKTFVLRALEAKLPQGRFRTTYIHNATVNLRDFYRQLSSALGLEPKATPAALFRMIHAHIEDLATAQKVRPVVILDEAHLLPVPVLGHLHILLNFHRDSKPLLSVILLGLTELRERLLRNVLAALAARLPIRIHIPPLDAEQTGRYLRHRLGAAGCAQEVFSEDATLLIAEATGGVLRKIDVLGTVCLEVAAQQKSSIVDAACVQEATKVCAEALV
jgi:type II secretory pathway predicted ATPase ExeA